MAEQEDVNKGLIGLPAAQIPNAFNPRGYVTDNFYVKGAPQTFGSFDDLVAFHPFKMGAGMSATVINHPEIGNVSSFRLVIEPSLLVGADKESLVVVGEAAAGTNQIAAIVAWELVETVQSTAVAVYMYAPDSNGGGAPIYENNAYPPEHEHVWEPIFNANKAHRWMRIRTDNVDEAPADGVFDNWTQPLRVGDSFTSGDYIENRFKRQAVSSALYENTAPPIDLSYAVLEGTITSTVNSKISYFSLGHIFLHTLANDEIWDFSSCKVQETVAPPPRTINGIPNNDPSADGWEDSIPTVNTEQLWQIWAQKSVYGQLKSDWRIKRINEDVNLIRYSNVGEPHPDTIVDTSTKVILGSTEDLALADAGWESTYNGHVLMATRDEITEDVLWTTWSIQKIEEESGEYVDNIFKLFEGNLNFDDAALEIPIGRDPTSDNNGWSDVPHTKALDDTRVNYISTARKFFDGTLKSPWTPPVPYGGQDAWADVISSDGPNGGDDFKYNGDRTEVIPSQLTLTAKLYKAASEMWINNTITYVWTIVFNNGGNGLSIGTEASTIGIEPWFYKLGAQGIEGDVNRIQEGQQVVITHEAVDGKAVIGCTQSIEISDGEIIEFYEEFSILDISDGNDAKALTINTDTFVLIWATDPPPDAIVPSNVDVRAYSANLNNTSLIWWVDVDNQDVGSSNWQKIIIGRPGYTLSGDILNFDTTVTNVDWAQDGEKQVNRYAVTNYDGDPDTPSAVIADEHFRDIVRISKLSSVGVGADGAPGSNAIDISLLNGTHAVVLNSNTGSAAPNQVGTKLLPASTRVQFWDGPNQRTYRSSSPGNDEWFISGVAVTSNRADGTGTSNPTTNVTGSYEHADGLLETSVWVANWLSDGGAANPTISAQFKISITYRSVVYDRFFTLASSIDAPGAIILDIDSDKGFEFNVNDDNRADKTLTAIVHDDTGGLTASDFFIRWTVQGTPGSWGTVGSNVNKIISHANIRHTADIICEINYTNSGTPFRTRTIRMSDVQDGKQFIFYHATLSPKPSKPSGNGRDNAQLQSWYRSDDAHWNSVDPVWASDGSESDTSGTFTWGAPYRIGGEEGSQGENGGFEMSLYKKDATVQPTVTDSIAKHLASGNDWLTTVPVPTEGSTIYVIKRFYKGEINGNTVQFESNGVPVWGIEYDDDNPSTKALGVWSIYKALIITPITPVVDNGKDGWSPIFQIKPYSNNTELLHVSDWVGGDGDKPSTGYISASGIGGPNEDGNIRGTDGTDGTDGDDGKSPISQHVSTTSSSSTIKITNNDVNRRVVIISGTMTINSGSTSSSTTRHLNLNVGQNSENVVLVNRSLATTSHSNQRLAMSVFYTTYVWNGEFIKASLTRSGGGTVESSSFRLTMTMI